MWAKAVDKCENASEPCNGMAQRHWARHKLHNGRIHVTRWCKTSGVSCRGVAQGCGAPAQGCVMTRSAKLRSDVPRHDMERARGLCHQGRLAPQPVDPPVAVPEDEDVLPLRLSSSCSFC